MAIPAVDLSSLFPSTQYYYRYYGSLTTPPCYESVIWTIFKEPIYMSASQVSCATTAINSLCTIHKKDSKHTIYRAQNSR